MPTESAPPPTAVPPPEPPPAEPPPQAQRRGYPPLSDLRRSHSDRKLVGVAGGLGRWAGIDPLVVRILFVVLVVFGGSGVLLYALGWLLIAEDGESESEGERLFNGRSRSSMTTVVVLVVAILAGLALTGVLFGSGVGVGGIGLLAVVAGAFLLLRNRDRAPDAAPYVVEPAGLVPPPGAYGQTPGTAYSAQAPVTAWPTSFTPPPPVPKERSILGRVTLSVALIVVGALVGWNGATDSDVSARGVLAAALAVVGVGLAVGAFAGRARGLVVWGVLLTLLATVAGLAEASVRGGAGERTWAPTSAAALRDTYRLGVGEAELDLTRLPASELVAAGARRVEVRQGIGDLLVIVPADLATTVVVDVGLGELELPDREQRDGSDLSDRVVSPPGADPSTVLLTIDAELGVGTLEVRRATS